MRHCCSQLQARRHRVVQPNLVAQSLHVIVGERKVVVKGKVPVSDKMLFYFSFRSLLQ